MDDLELARKLNVSKTKLQKVAKQKALPSRDGRDNRHVAILIDENVEYFKLKTELDILIDRKASLMAIYNDKFREWVKKIYLRLNPAEDQSSYRFYCDEIGHQFLRENYPKALEAKRKRLYELYNKEDKELENQLEELDNKLKKLKSSGIVYAKGNVYHRNAITGRSSREHLTLKLGDEWYRAVINTEIASWSMGGKFD